MIKSVSDKEGNMVVVASETSNDPNQLVAWMKVQTMGMHSICDVEDKASNMFYSYAFESPNGLTDVVFVLMIVN